MKLKDYFVLLFQVLVLLDVTPDQSMLDEGVAREVISRIQKLRKEVQSLVNTEWEIETLFIVKSDIINFIGWTLSFYELSKNLFLSSDGF